MCKTVDNYVQACVYQGKQEAKSNFLDKFSELMKEGLSLEDIYNKLSSD